MGFDGFVVSDWFAARSTGPSIKAGLSLEMPGKGQWYGPERIIEAIENDECTESELDEIVKDMLRLMQRTNAFNGVGGGEENKSTAQSIENLSVTPQLKEQSSSKTTVYCLSTQTPLKRWPS